MYNFSGVLFRIWGVCSVILMLGIILIIFEKPWKKGFSFKNNALSIGMVIFALALMGLYVSRIIVPDVSVFQGTLVKIQNNTRIAPPLPVTEEYVFQNNSGIKRGFYLDLFSKRSIIPYELEIGTKYSVHYDSFSSIILKIDCLS